MIEWAALPGKGLLDKMQTRELLADLTDGGSRSYKRQKSAPHWDPLCVSEYRLITSRDY